jgi:hypothetical protein
MNRGYSPEMRERVLIMLAEARPEHPTLMAAIRHVAGMLGMSPETLRLWAPLSGGRRGDYSVNPPKKQGMGWDRHQVSCLLFKRALRVECGRDRSGDRLRRVIAGRYFADIRGASPCNRDFPN